MSEGRAHRPKLPEARPHIEPAGGAAAVGKLTSSCVRSQSQGGGQTGAHTHIVSIISTGGFRVEGKVNGVGTSFLLDTGASATLLRQDTWERVNVPPVRKELTPCPEHRLVSVDGSPLQVHGRTIVSLDLAGERFELAVTVVSPLTSEAILGVDFLQPHQATIDLGRRQISFGKNRERYAPLRESVQKESVHAIGVVTAEAIQIPPCSEAVVMARTTDFINGGSWLVEGNWDKRLPAAVARALVEPRSGKVPVRLLNARAETVTVRAGSEIATLEPVEPLPDTVVASVEGAAQIPEKEEMLLRLVEQNGDELSGDEKEKFLALLIQYADVFALSGSDLGRTSNLKHEIPTGDAPPIRQAVRRMPPQRRQEVQELLSRMLKDDIIQPSSSPWAAPVVLVRKKNGSFRFCVDYRRLNEVTRKDAYPIPRIDDTLDTLAGSKLFTTLDLLSGYWQVEVAVADRAKTAFSTPDGLYEFTVMPFGLCNAPATFQRLMDLVLRGLQWTQCLVYIDDVIIPGRSFGEHLNNLQAVLQRLREAGLKLQPKKCAFLQRQVNYLGHVVTSDGVAADPAKVEKVSTWPIPTTVKEVQQFLGFAGYYRRFVKHFANVARPLHRLTERVTEFRWTDECQAAFDELRRRLVTSPVLAYPDYTKSFTLDTDASDTGIGGVLSQRDADGEERVIAYASRALSKPERNYCVTRRELLGVVYFAQYFRPYLLGRRFTLRTDHGSLTWLRNFKEPEGQLARWLERLQEFDFEILHLRGRKHTNADALSRRPCRQCGRESHGEEPAVSAVTLATPDPGLRKSQLKESPGHESSGEKVVSNLGPAGGARKPPVQKL